MFLHYQLFTGFQCLCSVLSHEYSTFYPFIIEDYFVEPLGSNWGYYDTLLLNILTCIF